MDRDTLSEYGWIVVVLIIISLVFAGIPALNSTITRGANNYVSSYFGDKGDEGASLASPSLILQVNELVITENSPETEEYVIFAGTEKLGTITAGHPTTRYDLSGLPDGSHKITVIGKSSTVGDSSGSVIYYHKNSGELSILAAPFLSIDGTSLIIETGDARIEKYVITLDGTDFSTVDAKYPKTTVDISSVAGGRFKVESQALGYESANSSISYNINSVTLRITKYIPDLNSSETAIDKAGIKWVPSTGVPYIATVDDQTCDKRAYVVVKRVSDDTVVGEGYEPYSNSNGSFEVTVNNLPDGEFTISIYKNCYFPYDNVATVTLSEANSDATINDVKIFAGDTPAGTTDEFCRIGSGKVDIDDNIVVMRSFDPEASAFLIGSVDINEDGITSGDVESKIIEATFGKSASDIYSE